MKKNVSPKIILTKRFPSDFIVYLGVVNPTPSQTIENPRFNAGNNEFVFMAFLWARLKVQDPVENLNLIC